MNKHKRINRKKTHQSSFEDVDIQDWFFDNRLNNKLIRNISAINRIYHMNNLPYNQRDSFESLLFINSTYKTINVINLPAIILKNIIEYLDIKSIYNLSRTCWKMLLFSRTNVITNYILKLFCNGDMLEFKKKSNKVIKYYSNINSYSDEFSKKFSNKINNNINNILNIIEKLVDHKNSYGFNTYKEHGHILEIALFGLKYIIFTYALEFTINDKHKKLIWRDPNNDNYDDTLTECDIEDQMKDKIKTLINSVCINNCNRYCPCYRAYYYDDEWTPSYDD